MSIEDEARVIMGDLEQAVTISRLLELAADNVSPAAVKEAAVALRYLIQTAHNDIDVLREQVESIAV